MSAANDEPIDRVISEGYMPKTTIGNTHTAMDFLHMLMAWGPRHTAGPCSG
jgi:hypothetical protein